MFSRRPVKKLSRHRTSWPSANNRSHKWEPIKPAPPVTRILMGFKFRVSSFEFRLRFSYLATEILKDNRSMLISSGLGRVACPRPVNGSQVQRGQARLPNPETP